MLLKAGVDVQFYDSGETHEIFGKLICGTCDAPARALFLNMKVHCGFYSCPVCCIRGEKSARTGDVLVFPYEENIPSRNVEDCQDQVRFAVENRVLHNKDLQNDERCVGIKGPTLLSHMVDNMFSSTAIDAMCHALRLFGNNTSTNDVMV